MSWRVEPHRDGGRLVWVDLQLPDGTSRRLQGMDFYWVSWPDYGAYNTDPGYEGRQAVSYRFSETGETDTGGIPAPPDAAVFRGEWVPDDRAREIGLL